MSTGSGELTLTVAVPTFQRPQRLRAGLIGILSQVNELNTGPGAAVTADVLVIDNDPTASAREIVTDLESLTLRYVVEPTPGISAARNRALSECRDRDLMVFIDDDEEPQPAWLASLVDTWLSTRATAVMGRVEFLFDCNLDPWIGAGGFFDRLRHTTGSEIPTAATGNLLLDLRQVRELDIRFDERLGLTGGEDNLFSRHLVSAGGRIVFCDESVAVDEVPRERLTREWLLARTRRVGITETAVEVYAATSLPGRLRARMLGAIRGVTRIVGGALRFALGLFIRSQRHRAQGERILRRGHGMVVGALGVAHEEYARSPAGRGA